MTEAAITSGAGSERPHVFISYSWTSSDHQQWVKDLARSLTDSNVHALLDVWDLKTGEDAVQYMERMVTDPKVTKVLILADKAYVEKADGRSGGVGTETQIISPKIYGSQEAGKFALVVCERDENGRPYLPTYYSSRIYIDLSDPARYSDEFERLLRWIYDKPADVRPAYGAAPSFLTEDGATTNLGTDTQSRRGIDAVLTGKPYALGAFTEYLKTFSTNLERFRIKRNPTEPFDETVTNSIRELRPYKDQLLTMLHAVATHTDSREYGARLHGFLEDLFRYSQPRESSDAHYENDLDNFAFLIHEIFLNACAIFLRTQRFDLLLEIVGVDYFLPRRFESSEVSSYDRFSAFGMRSLEERKRRLSLNRISLHADLLLERTEGSLVSRSDLLQADLFLYLRSHFMQGRWYSTTYMFTERLFEPFEIFARAVSASFFERLRPALGIGSSDEFKAWVIEIKGDPYSRSWGGLESLVGLQGLCTRL